ncbi:MAG: sugar transferase [Planctomycetaceae bacterium]
MFHEANCQHSRDGQVHNGGETGRVARNGVAAQAIAPEVAVISGWYLPIKTTVDWSLACLLLILTGPVTLVAAILVKLTSRGPAFYSQMRLGKDGVPFRLYKLRTMVHNAEATTGPVWSTADDPRVTRLGRILRLTHIDEFPQLINVVRGEMSLVGPRPERPEFVSRLEWEISNYRSRLTVRPGITGLAQLRLPPDTDLESVQRKLVCDLYYVRHVNPWLDLQLLMATGWSLGGALLRHAWACVALPNQQTIERGYRPPVAPPQFASDSENALPVAASR